MSAPKPCSLSAAGAYVVIPSDPADALGLLKSSIRDDNPVLFFEHAGLYAYRGEVPTGDHLVPLGKAAVKREGSDVTVIAWSRMVGESLRAAEQLAAEGDRCRGGGSARAPSARHRHNPRIGGQDREGGDSPRGAQDRGSGRPRWQPSSPRRRWSTWSRRSFRVASADVPIPQSRYLQQFLDTHRRLGDGGGKEA